MDNPRDPPQLQQQRQDSNDGLGDLSFNMDFNADSAVPFGESGQADASFFGGSDDGYGEGGAADSEEPANNDNDDDNFSFDF